MSYSELELDYMYIAKDGAIWQILGNYQQFASDVRCQLFVLDVRHFY